MTTKPVASIDASLRSTYAAIDLHGGSSKTIWPPEPLPPMTRAEAISAGKRLWRRFAGRGWPGTWRAGRGNHRIYPRGSVMLVNPGLGWRRFVHDLSHCLYDHMTRTSGHYLWVKSHRLPVLSQAVIDNYKTARPKDHTDDHAHLEKAMVAMVIENGWLDGKLKPAPKEPKPKLSVRERNEAKVDKAGIRWLAKLKKAEADLKRAKKKLAELRSKKKRYQKEIVFTL